MKQKQDAHNKEKAEVLKQAADLKKKEDLLSGEKKKLEDQRQKHNQEIAQQKAKHAENEKQLEQKSKSLLDKQKSLD